ncbi:high-potential iron-sulfur protein [Humitalea sp. 24SJ18S-53]|uniref:high-potential iron-sulfur protein n=1 Tax=Humitalea sp. 24SJ18S-53 TaxID=3422307 RepID=UPI003D66F246
MQYDIGRRSAYRAVLGAGLGAVAGVVAPARAQEKMAQSMVMYQATPQGAQRCDNCLHWQAPAACAIVAGTIAPAGWCGVWAAKPS